jgi:DNA primase
LIEQRGVVRADVEKWRIGYDAEMRRATFPVWDIDRNLVGVSRRTVCGVEPKFYDTPGPWKQEVFYGEHLLDATRETAHLVEGVLGTVFASRVLPNTLGLLGAHTGLGERRLAKLRRWCRVVVLVLDADEAGDLAVYGDETRPGLRTLLRPYFVVKVARLPRMHAGRPVKDPADIPGDVLANAVEAAIYLTSRGA